MGIYLSPSLLSVDFARVKEQLDLIEQAGTKYLHLDVMDGVFVPNISFGMPVIKSLRKATDMVFDVHLMIVDPEKYVEEFIKAGADIITFHVEATKDVAGTIKKIKDLGIKVGLTLKPKTPISDILPYLNELDMVLVMTVEPGFGGQSFMSDQVKKIEELNHFKKELGLAYDIEVDGGITTENVKIVLDAGANVVVAGSAVFGQVDMEKAVKDFTTIFKEYE